MNLLLKLIFLGVVIAILYYLTFELHLLDVILTKIITLSKSFIDYGINSFYNMIGDLI